MRAPGVDEEMMVETKLCDGRQIKEYPNRLAKGKVEKEDDTISFCI